MTTKKKVAKSPQFCPLHDNVLITKDREDSEEKKTPGGLIVPTAARKPPNTAKVIAVGPDVKGINSGDVVVVGKFSGTDVVVDDEEFVVIRFEDVLGLYK